MANWNDPARSNGREFGIGMCLVQGNLDLVIFGASFGAVYTYPSQGIVIIHVIIIMG